MRFWIHAEQKGNIAFKHNRLVLEQEIRGCWSPYENSWPTNNRGADFTASRLYLQNLYPKA